MNDVANGAGAVEVDTASRASSSKLPVTGEAAPPAPAAAAEVLSTGQVIVNRYFAQFSDLMEIHRQLVTLKGAVVAAPGASVNASEPAAVRERKAPLFSALTMIADADDAVIAAIKQDLKDIVALF